MKFIAGEEVRWLSRASYTRWMKGKVIRTLEGGAVVVVKDGTGLTPRCLDATRLQPVVERRQRFAGSLA